MEKNCAFLETQSNFNNKDSSKYKNNKNSDSTDTLKRNLNFFHSVSSLGNKKNLPDVF